MNKRKACLGNILAIAAAICCLFGMTSASGDVVGGYVASSSNNLVFMDGDGSTVLAVTGGPVSNLTGLSNGNVVSRTGADVWTVQSATGAGVGSKQLDNLGVFNEAAPVGGGGYAAISNSHLIFMGADGTTVNGVVSDTATLVTPLSNGNLVGRLAGDNWRLYSATGSVLATRQLDNLGVYNNAAATGGGGYVALSDSRMVFMGNDGTTVNNVLVEAVTAVSSLTNGNIAGLVVGTDTWKVYSPAGAVLATRVLDNLGSYLGSASLGGGGYLAYTNSNAIFMAADGLTVNAIVPNALEYVTALNNGNVVGKIVGQDLWRLFSSTGTILETRLLDNLGTYNGAAPTGLAVAIPESSAWKLLGVAGIMVLGLARWRMSTVPRQD